MTYQENKYEDELPIDSNCEFCSEPIRRGEGRTRIGGKDYHRDSQSDSFMESVKHKAESQAVVEKCAESMLFDKRIAG